MLKNFQILGCNMTVKLHFLDSHLDFFPEKLADFSEEHGERFHQELKEMEKRYKGKGHQGLLADYCWHLIRETDQFSKKCDNRCFRIQL